MAHEHAHGGGHHHHGVSPAADRRWLAIALATVLAFMVVEVVAGVLASSLALLSDAAHMLTDAGALVMSLVVLRLVAQPAGGNRRRVRPSMRIGMGAIAWCHDSTLSARRSVRRSLTAPPIFVPIAAR